MQNPCEQRQIKNQAPVETQQSAGFFYARKATGAFWFLLTALMLLLLAAFETLGIIGLIGLIKEGL